jgi:hypothetical protein
LKGQSFEKERKSSILLTMMPGPAKAVNREVALSPGHPL